jgi:hypothetical protein
MSPCSCCSPISCRRVACCPFPPRPRRPRPAAYGVSRARGMRSGWSAHPPRAGEEGVPYTALPARGLPAVEACPNSHDHPKGWSSLRSIVWPSRASHAMKHEKPEGASRRFRFLLPREKQPERVHFMRCVARRSASADALPPHLNASCLGDHSRGKSTKGRKIAQGVWRIRRALHVQRRDG